MLQSSATILPGGIHPITRSPALLLKDRLQLLTQIYTEDLDEDILADED